MEAHALPAGKLFPDTKYNLAKLRAMDADVRLKVEHLSATAVPLEDMDAHLLLDAGVLRLEPLNFGVADGTVRSTIRMDGREQVAKTQSRIQARGHEPVQADSLRKFGKTRSARRRRFLASGAGNSVADMLANANGDAGVGMARARSASC